MTISYSGNFISLLKRWKGSVWKAVWKEAAVFLSLYYAIRLVLAFYLAEDQYQAAAKVVKMFDYFTTKIPLQFLLGFYVGQTVNRWWAQVLAVPWPDDIMVWANVFFNKDDPWTRLKRRMIARYLILTETLVLRNVSTRIRKRFPTMQSLVKSGLMTQTESDCYHRLTVENTRWQAPLQWIIHGIIAPAVRDEEINQSSANTLIGKINDFRNNLRTIYVYDWVCIPLVYTQTCSVVVYGYFGFCLIGHQYIGTDADLYIPWLTLLQFIFFVGWFKVAQDLMRPFGEDDDDIELNVLLDRHTAVAMNYAEQLCDVIPPMPDKPPEKPPSDDDAAPNGEIVISRDDVGKDNALPPDAEKTEDGDRPPDVAKKENTSLLSEAAKKQSSVTPPDFYQPPPFTRLPYTRASLRSPKDHCPKLHAHVKIKNPEEEEFVGGGPLLPTTSGPVSRATMQNQMARTMQAIQAWQKLVTAPYDKFKPHRRANHF